jgi:hypothetical protein
MRLSSYPAAVALPILPLLLNHRLDGNYLESIYLITGMIPMALF